MSDDDEVVTIPRLEKRTRRRFSVAENRRLLAECEGLGHAATSVRGAAGPFEAAGRILASGSGSYGA